jgi:hypothetical protein
VTADLDSLVNLAAPLSDADAVRSVRPETRRALLLEIAATDPAASDRRWARRGRRRAFLLPLMVGLAGAATTAVVAVSAVGGEDTREDFDPHQVAALTFTKRTGYVEVRIKDPYADPARYKREFRAHGMKIGLTLVAASPSAVGTIVFQGESDGPDRRPIKPIEEGRCMTGGGGDKCLRGLRIPVGYKNETEISFGREPRRGEKYSSTNSSFAYGEALHCLDIRGMTVAQALKAIKTRGQTAPVFHVDRAGGADNLGKDRVPDGWFVYDALPWAKGEVLLWVRADRQSIRKTEGYRAMFKGC